MQQQHQWLDISAAPRVETPLEHIKSEREKLFEREKDEHAELKNLRGAFEAEFLRTVGCRVDLVDRIDALRRAMRQKHAEEEARFRETYGEFLDARDTFCDGYVQRVSAVKAELDKLDRDGRKTLEDVKARLNLPEDTVLLLEKAFDREVRDKRKEVEDGRNVVRNLLMRHFTEHTDDSEKKRAALEVARSAGIQGDDGEPLPVDEEAMKKTVKPMPSFDAYEQLSCGSNKGEVDSKYCPV